jgi:hypothetical protein
MVYLEPGTECTAPSVAAAWPCVACLDPVELESALIVLLQLATGRMLETMDQILEASACFTCFSDTQMKQAIVKMLATEYGEQGERSENVTTMEYIKCWVCAQPKQRRAALLYLICQYIERCGDSIPS